MLKSKKILVLILGVFLITRLPFFCSGFLPLESDELNYHQWTLSFQNHQWPVFQDIPYFEQIPLFSYLASFLPSSSSCPYIQIRTLSLLGTLIITITLTFFFKNTFLKLLAAFLFLFNPLVMFYSKTGVLDMMMIAFLSLSSLHFYKKKKHSTLYAGAFFGLAVMIKTAALYFSLLFVLEFLYQILKNKKIISIIKKFLPIFLGFILTIVSISAPFIYFFKKLNPNTSLQLSRVPSIHLLPLNNLTVHLAVIFEYFKQSWFLMGILAPALFFPLFYLIKNHKNRLHRFIFLGNISTLIFLSLFTFSPRYLLYLSFFTSLSIVIWLKEIKSAWLGSVLVLVISFQSLLAFNSLNHNSFEEVAQFVNSNYPQESIIHSSYSPEKIEFIFNRDAVWFDSNELRAGDLIFIEELRSRDFATFGPKPNLKQDIDQIRNTLTPIYTIIETSPNFPYTRENNKIELYLYE